VERPVVVELGSGRRAVAIGLEREEDLPAVVGALRLGAPRPALVVVGGAAGLDEGDLAALAPVADVLVQAADGAGAAIVDGGTDAGVMRLVGRAHGTAAADVPLVGVVVRALAAPPGEEAVAPAAAIEPHHTHLVLVPGSRWGDEAPWLARLAGTVAGGLPSVTVLVNGGDVSVADVEESVAAGRRVLVIAGSGRTADALAAAAGGASGDARVRALVDSGLVEAVAAGDDPLPSLEERVNDILGSSRPGRRR
jgi:hypothetical protein